MRAIIKVYKNNKMLYERICGNLGSVRNRIEDAWQEDDADKFVIEKIYPPKLDN